MSLWSSCSCFLRFSKIEGFFAGHHSSHVGEWQLGVCMWLLGFARSRGNIWPWMKPKALLFQTFTPWCLSDALLNKWWMFTLKPELLSVSLWKIRPSEWSSHDCKKKPAYAHREKQVTEKVWKENLVSWPGLALRLFPRDCVERDYVLLAMYTFCFPSPLILNAYFKIRSRYRIFETFEIFILSTPHLCNAEQLTKLFSYISPQLNYLRF